MRAGIIRFWPSRQQEHLMTTPKDPRNPVAEVSSTRAISRRLNDFSEFSEVFAQWKGQFCQMSRGQFRGSIRVVAGQRVDRPIWIESDSHGEESLALCQCDAGDQERGLVSAIGWLRRFVEHRHRLRPSTPRGPRRKAISAGRWQRARKSTMLRGSSGCLRVNTLNGATVDASLAAHYGHNGDRCRSEASTFFNASVASASAS